LVRSRLEAAGIPTYVRDELTIQMYWLFSNALGGVSVQVPDDYADAARELVWSESGVESESPSVECPQCGSGCVRPIEWPGRVAHLSLLMLSFPLPFTTKRRRCEGCGKRWR
jgi:hypothetical protein